MPALVELFVTPLWGMLADRFPNIRLWMGLATFCDRRVLRLDEHARPMALWLYVSTLWGVSLFLSLFLMRLLNVVQKKIMFTETVGVDWVYHHHGTMFSIG